MGGRPATTATHATHSAPQAATEKNPAQNCAICCSRGRVEINNKSKLNVCLLDTLASSSGFSWDVSALILLLSAEFYVLFIYFRSALLCVRLLAPEKKDQKKICFIWFQWQLISPNRREKSCCCVLCTLKAFSLFSIDLPMHCLAIYCFYSHFKTSHTTRN